jgi:taurine--2-oxoglutarate transaminase
VFWAIELVSDRKTKAPLAEYPGTSPAMAEIVTECRKRGYLPFTMVNRVHVVPPCVITPEQAKEGLAILDEVLTLTDKHYVG